MRLAASMVFGGLEMARMSSVRKFGQEARSAVGMG